MPGHRGVDVQSGSAESGSADHASAEKEGKKVNGIIFERKSQSALGNPNAAVASRQQ